jgi:RNA polymerase sigma-70 factor (ECF subfamily)
VLAPGATPDSDLVLIHRIAAGDHDAFTELYGRHRAAMHAVAYRMARETSLVEDAVQDASLQVWKDAVKYDVSRGPVLAWMLIIVRGRTLDRLRARQLRERRAHCGVDPESARAATLSSESVVSLQETARQVTDVMNVLPAADRDSLALAYHDGLTQAEIAVRLDIPIGTAKTRLRRGLQVLRTAIDGRPRRPFEWRRANADVRGDLRLAGRRLLVVDDEPDTLRLTSLVLKRAGAAVVTAGSARQALSRVESAWPDLAFVDLEMPDVDGYALMARLRDMCDRRQRRLPAVAFTAQIGVERRIKAAGFDLYLTKPILPALLIAQAASLIAP